MVVVSSSGVAELPVMPRPCLTNPQSRPEVLRPLCCATCQRERERERERERQRWKEGKAGGRDGREPRHIPQQGSVKSL